MASKQHPVTNFCSALGTGKLLNKCKYDFDIVRVEPEATVKYCTLSVMWWKCFCEVVHVN